MQTEQELTKGPNRTLWLQITIFTGPHNHTALLQISRPGPRPDSAPLAGFFPVSLQVPEGIPHNIHDTQVHEGEVEDCEQHSSHQPVTAADCPRVTTWLGQG